MTSTDDLWYSMASQIKSEVKPTFDPTKEQFSFGSIANEIDLANPDGQTVGGYVYQLGNTIPASSPDYIAGSGLLSAYSLFLANIDLKGSSNPNLDRLINVAAAAYNTAQGAYNSALTQAMQLWTAYKVAFPNVGFNDFVAQNYPTYISAKSGLTGAQSKLSTLMSQKYGAGYEQIQNAMNDCGSAVGAADLISPNSFNMEVKLGNTTLPGSTPSVPGATGTPSANTLTPIYVPLYTLEGFETVLSEWEADSAAGKVGASFAISSNSGDSEWSQMGWSQESMSTTDAFFFDINSFSQSSGSSSSTHDFEDQWSMTVDFVGLAVFTLQPGTWFDLALISSFRNQLLAGAPDLFGPSGSLARVPSQVVLGYGPSITMTLSNRDYTSYKAAAQSSSTSGWGIGPFYVQSSGSQSQSSSASASWNDSSNSITISPPPSVVPVLLGVISTRTDALN